ncbi:MAG: hypothetical protein ACYDBQ_12230 [Thermoplasmatota archaeon]
MGGPPWRHLLLRVAGVLSLAAAAIHAGVSQEHFAEWWGYGLFFIVASLGQGVLGLVLLAVPRRPSWGGPSWMAWTNRLYVAGIAGNVAILLLYLVTRTSGIPFLGPGAGRVEAIAPIDVLAAAIEVGVAACLAFLVFLAKRATKTRPLR